MKRSALFLAVFAWSCGHAVTAPKPAPPAHIEFRVDGHDVHAVVIEAHFVSVQTTAFAIADETVSAITSIEARRGGAWVKLEASHHIEAAECRTDCTLRYTLDLAKAETGYEGIYALPGASFLTPTSSWMLRPSPMPRGKIDMFVDPAPEAHDAFEPTPFATGMRREGNHFTMSTFDFNEGSYAAFGNLRHRIVQSAGGAIEVVTFPAPKLSLSDDEVATWVREAGECVAQLYGHFPVAHATVFIVPAREQSEVVFGRVLSLGGASIAVLTGTNFTAKVTHDDWVLVHEMSHLGFPTVNRERWLGEGLATYYEPVLRARMGWRPREKLWSGFAHAMKRGLPDPNGEMALDKRDTIDDVYWGGAIFVMMTDVGIRAATNNKKSLDDVMVAILAAGGDATVEWRMPRILEYAEKATGTKVMTDLHERQAVRGERIDLEGFLGDLGIHTDPIVLRSDARFSALRESIENKR